MHLSATLPLFIQAVDAVVNSVCGTHKREQETCSSGVRQSAGRFIPPSGQRHHHELHTAYIVATYSYIPQVYLLLSIIVHLEGMSNDIVLVIYIFFLGLQQILHSQSAKGEQEVFFVSC